ncbi:MAG: hypothetical protein R3A47_00555 [Polyangiales bacterium]
MEKIVVNMGLGEAVQNGKIIEAVVIDPHGDHGAKAGDHART